MTLRTRFAAILGGSVFAAMMLVAAVAALALNAALRTALDSHLLTTARAVSALVDVQDGQPRLDGDDSRQARVLLGLEMQGAVFDNAGRETASLHGAGVPSEVQQAQAGGGERLLSASNMHDERVAIVPVTHHGEQYGVAAVWGRSGYIDEYVRNALVTIFLVALVAGALALAGSWLVAKRALAPLERVATVAEEIEAHDLSRRLAFRGKDEVARVAAAFDRMLERLQAAFDRQKRFTADASHELRAPLAVMRAEADVALERERTNAEYKWTLKSISQEVERADNVIAALLAAARSERPLEHREPESLLDLVAAVAERFEPVVRRNGLQLTISGDDVEGLVDHASLDRAVSAIVHNALDAAKSEVRILTQCADGHASIRIADDGPGFTAEALQSATQRFWRGTPGSREGSGLGLAIADSVVRAHGGSLRLQNALDGGAVVTIVLPRSS